MKITRSKGKAFYMTLAAAVLMAAALVFYPSADGAARSSTIFAAASLIADLAVLTACIGPLRKAAEYIPTLAAILSAASIAGSLSAQVDGFGYLVSGLYSFADMQNYIFYLICAAAAMLLTIFASFTNVTANAQ